MSWEFRLGSALLAALALAAPIAAQQPVPAGAAVEVAPTTLAAEAPVSAEAAPARARSVVLRETTPAPPYSLDETARAETATTGRALLPALQSRRANGRTLMIVGGAALLVGAVIGGDGGDVIMIGGAVIGLVGLYQYLR